MGIQPINNNGSVLLRFTHQRKRYSIAGFGKYTDPIAQAKAQAIAAKITADMALGTFDITLDSYKPQNLSPVATKQAKQNQQSSNESLANILNSFIQYKSDEGSLSNSRIKNFGTWQNWIARTESHHQNDVSALIKLAIGQFPAYRPRILFGLLKQALEWHSRSSEYSLPDWDELGKLIPKSKKGENQIDLDGEINPFTEMERDAILDHLKGHPRYGDYYQYVAFLFFTGCRPGEATGLRWGSVSKDKLTFRESLTVNDHSQRLKSQKSRTISISPRVRIILTELPMGEKDDFVFRYPDGKPIISKDLASHKWKAVLEGAGVEYRKLYNTRHTFATLAIKRGISPQILARHLGNTIAMIDRYYCGSTTDIIIE